MDNLYDSRLSRSLLVHNLDNLVFEKRQRKSTQQNPPPNLVKPHPPKPPPKKKPKVQEAEQKVNHQQKKINNLKKKKPIDKKKLPSVARTAKHKKTHKNESFESEDEVIQESVSSSSEQPIKIIRPKTENTHKITSKDQPQNNKQQQLKIIRGEKKGESNFREPVEKKGKEAKEEVGANVKEEEGESSELAHDQNKNKNQGSAEKKRRGRPKKIKIEPDPAEIQPKSEQAQASEAHEQKHETVAAHPHNLCIIQRTVQVIQLVKNQPAHSIQNSQMPQPSEARSRRAKMNPLIKYNQNDQDLCSDQSFQTSKQLRRRKKIFKNARNRNRDNKPYQLNRIFRKEAKRNFPSFEISVDLNKLSLASFVKQFGIFDLIHSSLPLSFLHSFPEMPLLMEKGFIFIWVEQKETQIGYHLLNRWGFDVIDQIIWIKANEDEGKIEADNIDPAKMVATSDEATDTRELFVNMKSTCLVGYKCPLGNKAEYRTKVSNNIIFALAQKGIRKPAEIYQIADLMMPGAKKLQLGGSAQKGWLNLKHHQKTLGRCSKCFKQQHLYLLSAKQEASIKCKKCIIHDLSQTQEDAEALKTKFNELNKNKIVLKMYANEYSTLKCLRCGKEGQEIQESGLITSLNSNEKMCLKCFRISLNTPENQSDIKIILPKRHYYNALQTPCSICEAETIYDLYFECTKNKNQRICKKCFWKLGEITEQDGTEKQKKQKNANEWKLKFVKNYPLMKFTCFGCKTDLCLPFWTCETCQSWAWCGQCERGTSEVHPHCQTGDHKQYLMI